MMKSSFFIMAPLMVLSTTIAQEEQGNKWNFHREVLKQRFDTEYWKTIWEDELWHIRTIFVAMDGDGMEEMMAITTSEEDRMGDYWKMWKYDNAGKFKLLASRDFTLNGISDSTLSRRRMCSTAHSRNGRHIECPKGICDEVVA